MQIANKKSSIYTQLLRLLVFAAMVASFSFFVLDELGTFLINMYLEQTDYIERENTRYVKKLQKAIQDSNISSTDTSKINNWVKKQQIISVRIYKNDIQIFDSDYPEQDIWEEEIAAGNYAWENYYSICFTDGEAEVLISGDYTYRFFSCSLIAEICFSFFVFLGLVLLGIRRKMKYILKLSSEIEILEGGNLDYPITVEGKDELSVLASGLDNMRISFQNMIQREEEMIRENQRIVTELSHDLRTPVTTIMLYTEVLKKGNYAKDDSFISYIDKIDKKARRMKQLTDHLFEYSFIAGKDKTELEAPELYETIFYDLLSETCSYLNQRGFETIFHVEWKEDRIRVSTSYVMRIMDNITSNIVKYAEPSCPVCISSIERRTQVGFVFENTIRRQKEKCESTGIGIQNIKKMMLQMGGTCEVEASDGKYRLMILFPYCEL